MNTSSEMASTTHILRDALTRMEGHCVSQADDIASWEKERKKLKNDIKALQESLKDTRTRFIKLKNAHTTEHAELEALRAENARLRAADSVGDDEVFITSKKPKRDTPKRKRGTDQSPDYKYVEVVRGKEAREALPGHACKECEKFYNVLENNVYGADREKLMKEFSRHRHACTPPHTPEGFWDMTLGSIGAVSPRRAAKR